MDGAFERLGRVEDLGRMPRVGGSVVAMSEQEMAVPQLGAEYWYGLVAETVQDYALTMLDPDGRIVSWNAGAERMKGYRAEKVLGRHFSIFYRKEAVDGGHPEEELRIAAIEGRYSEEGWRVRKDGTEFLAFVLISAMWDDSGKLVGFSKVVHDLTKQKREGEHFQMAVEAVRHSRELAKELERTSEAERAKTRALEMRDDFLSHVSHELRAPLAAISAFSSIIEDGLAGPTTDDQKEYLGIIQKNAKQLESMIEDLLAVRASQTGKLRVEPREASLAQAIADALQTCESKAKAKGVTLSSDIAECLGAAYADPVRLVQVLIILCDNAIKFTPAGGSVQVPAMGRDSGYLLAEVADSGCGIGPELKERVFDHLYQVEGASRSGRTGLGLGLHIARELVTQQGGEIWVESALGTGSCFCFTVPVFEAKAAELERKVA